MPLKNLQNSYWIYDFYQLGQPDLVPVNANESFEQILLCHVLKELKATSGSLSLCQGDNNNCLRIVAGTGLSENYVGRVIPVGVGVIGWVMENKQALFLKGNANHDARLREPVIKPDSQIPSTALCWPLAIGNRLIGVLCANSFDEGVTYTEADLERNHILVNLTTLVIENSWLHGTQQKRIEELAAINDRYINSNKQLQETHNRLQQSEKRLTEILDSLDSVVWSMTPKTLEMLYLNQAVEEISGRPVADFFNDPHLWFDIIYPRDRKWMEASLDNLRSTDVQKLTYRILRPDGELRWLFHHMRIVNDDLGTPTRIDGITVDITQHKIAEDLLKQRNEELQTALDKIQEVQSQLVQSEKLASVGQLAAGVAHEINNPIGYMNSNLTSLKNYVKDLLDLVALYENTESVWADAEQQCTIQEFKNKIDLEFLKTDVLDLLDESHEGACRVKKIVQDLKDFSHAGGSDEWQWANLHNCLESTLNIVNNEIKYKAKVIKEYGDIPDAWCLPHQLNQVFMNLLVNAAHAIENEGTITIRTGSEPDHIWVEVSDTGKGIAPEHINKIFDPFFTTKPVGKGTGLGLSVSYSIVKKHNGEIRLDSRVGEGTTFRILLPKKAEPNTP
ncbi:MAG: PAS domain-containing protein [Methylococcaceae bacterium]|nr:PAS domain-containing protein [Methylococcaceae bacterium]